MKKVFFLQLASYVCLFVVFMYAQSAVAQAHWVQMPLPAVQGCKLVLRQTQTFQKSCTVSATVRSYITCWALSDSEAARLVVPINDL